MSTEIIEVQAVAPVKTHTRKTRDLLAKWSQEASLFLEREVDLCEWMVYLCPTGSADWLIDGSFCIVLRTRQGVPSRTYVCVEQPLSAEMASQWNLFLVSFPKPERTHKK